MAGTIQQVAAMAGVSVATVSRAFSRPELLRAETRDAVIAAARQLGYVPNRSARALTTGRTDNLALVLPDIANPYFPPIVKAAQSRAHDSGFSVFLADTDNDPETERRLVSSLIRQVDGVLLCSSRLDEVMIKEFSETKPVVTLNRVVDGVPAVLVDTAGGMRQAVEHLVALGHRSVACLGGPTESWSNQARLEGATAQAAEHDITLKIFGPYLANFDAGRQAADSVLATDATAILAYDDLMALGVLDRLVERGAEVPADMSVVGFDNVLRHGTVTPALTTVDARCPIAGRTLVDVLVKLLANADAAGSAPRLTLPTQLIVRSSTAAPRQQHN